MSFFQPDRYFSRVSRIDIERDLLAPGFTNVLLDIDNTLRRRDNNLIPLDVGLWLGRARDAGVRFCLFSNNWHGDVRDLATELELPLVAKAMKPLPPAFARGMRVLGSDKGDTVVVGDQLVTDVVGAHLAGLPAYLIAPLVEQDLPHTLALRKLERVLLAGRAPEGAAGAVGARECAGGEGAVDVQGGLSDVK